MAEQDVKQNGGQSDTDEDLQDKSHKAGASSDIEAGDESENKPPRDIPYSRFKEVNDEAKESKQIVDWYRKNIGDPNDVVEFQKWKQAQLARAKEDAEDGEISPAKLAAIKKLMRAADPEYAEFLERQKTSDKERLEAQFDDAEDQIRELAKTAGLPQDEKIITRVGRHIMEEINSDPKLLRQWQTGNLSCIKRAFTRYQEEYLAPMRKTAAKPTNDLADKRRIARLPSLPSGGSASTSRAPERKPEDRGINKQTHEDAWAVVQSHLQGD
jgi:hypothetical protein